MRTPPRILLNTAQVEAWPAWLLSARSNFNLTDKLTLFVAGTNLTDELYIADLSDGAKPGQGRTIYGGFTLKFD